MHVVAHSSDQQTIVAVPPYAGFKRDLDGEEWTHIGDNLYGGAHWLAVVSGKLDDPT